MPQSHENQDPETSARPAPAAARPAPAAGPAAAPMSRRSVLRSAAGAGAAGLVMSTLAAPALAASRHDTASRHDAASRDATEGPADGTQGEHGEAVVVHVRDVRTGELDVYRGTTHVRLTDRALAARLARASR